MPYRFRHVLARLERVCASSRGVKIWLDDRPVYCAPDSVPTFGGLGPDHVEDRWMMQRVFENLRPGDAFLDVGSHFGLYAIGAALRVGPQGNVLAFEPTPLTVRKLRRNIQLNGLSARVTVHAVAVSDKDGVAEFAASGSSMMNSLCSAKVGSQPGSHQEVERLQIPTRRLDEFFDRARPTVAKIDTEGAEIAVLRGAPQLLASDARIYLELHPWAWGGEEAGWGELLALARAARRTICRLDGEALAQPIHGRTELVRVA
jgi:FkbM family methyltransferase